MNAEHCVFEKAGMNWGVGGGGGAGRGEKGDRGAEKKERRKRYPRLTIKRLKGSAVSGLQKGFSLPLGDLD